MERQTKVIFDASDIYSKALSNVNLWKPISILKMYKKHYILTKQDNRKDSGSKDFLISKVIYSSPYNH